MPSHSASSVTYRTTQSAAEHKAISEKALAENPRVIELIHKIQSHQKEPDDLTIALAKDVSELRQIVETEKLNGGQTWFEWAPKNLKLGGRSKLYLLQQIAASANPRETLDRILHQGCDRSKNRRERQKSQKVTDQARQALIDWARVAPLWRVETILKAVSTSQPLILKQAFYRQ